MNSTELGAFILGVLLSFLSFILLFGVCFPNAFTQYGFLKDYPYAIDGHNAVIFFREYKDGEDYIKGGSLKYEVMPTNGETTVVPGILKIEDVFGDK